MRVAIFFDGKNFYSGLKNAVGVIRLDFPKLAGWLVSRSGGDVLWAAHYYTGVESGDAAATDAQLGLSKFLDLLEMQPGFFVHRFRRKADRRTCPNCGSQISFTQEKEVDTSMVADMLRLAAVDGFDILVLVSGDADLAPAVENVRALGKKVLVATWGFEPLARRLREAAFDHVDLRGGLDQFRFQGPPGPEAEVAAGHANAEGGAEAGAHLPVDDAEASAEAAFLLELRRAEQQFSGGYVGVSFFLTRWRSDVLDPVIAVRQRLLNRLIDDGRVQLYDAPDGSGSKAMKLAPKSGDLAS